MKVANWELENTKAKVDIVKLEVVKKKRKNWDNLTTPKGFDLKKNLITIEIPELQQKENSTKK